MKKIKYLSILIVCLTITAAGIFYGTKNQKSDDIIILYTNDVHTYIDKNISYDHIASIKQQLQEEYEYVFLVDAGDHIQGTAYGSMDKGNTIIELMNQTGYDLATLGNHEFDYGMEGCMNVIEWANYPYLSCNFYHELDGKRTENVLDSFMIKDCGDEKIAFIGITTPESFSKSTPAYFQNDKGEYIYGISGGPFGEFLYEDVQTAIDEAKDAGATYVIGLGHLGVDASSLPYTSEETIANVSGFDAFIDGHSHSVIEAQEVVDKDGESVLLTQTGEYLERIGIMKIDADTKELTTDFIELEGSEEEGYSLSSDLYANVQMNQDDRILEIKNNWISQIDASLGKNIGKLEVVLDNYAEDETRLVRMQETNSGDFSADALYYLFDDMNLDVDIAIVNGGGIRNGEITGDISYKTCKDMQPFGNVACLQSVSGQQILDMLEWGARHVGVAENGGFLQVSGLTYKINTSIPDTTTQDDKEVWIKGPSQYRVYDVKIYNKETADWDTLDLNANYQLAGYNYTLRDLGDGYAMLKDSLNIIDYVMEDYMVLANYVQGFEDGIVKADNSPLAKKYPNFKINYANKNGSERIMIAQK